MVQVSNKTHLGIFHNGQNKLSFFSLQRSSGNFISPEHLMFLYEELSY